jgi:hypothetical protein
MTPVLDQAERAALLERNAEAYARIALANVQREYPVHLSYLVTGPGPLPLPRERHPAFYGSFDWHSCVHMHWSLARLLRLFPTMPCAREAREVLARHLMREAIAAEASYLAAHPSFERPYGWAWALMLAAELERPGDPDAGEWAEHLRPLAELIETLMTEWLAKATYPLRTGLHGNTAFALSLALRYARPSRPELERAIVDAGKRWFGGDRDYPAAWEPSGSDFLSPALTEAVLMDGVLHPDGYLPWLDGFLPGLAHGEPRSLFEPAAVSDPRDGQIAHLHGLNLSRAWCMRRIAASLPPGDPRGAILERAAQRHAEASLGVVAGSDYAVEHWLVSFAILLLG